MQVTRVTFRELANTANRLLGVCSVELDEELVVHDVKLLQGNFGKYIGMPSRPKFVRCSSCQRRCGCTDKYCRECGSAIVGAAREFVDVTHPVNQALRDRITTAVMEAYHADRVGDAVPERG